MRKGPVRRTIILILHYLVKMKHHTSPFQDVFIEVYQQITKTFPGPGSGEMCFLAPTSSGPWSIRYSSGNSFDGRDRSRVP